MSVASCPPFAFLSSTWFCRPCFGQVARRPASRYHSVSHSQARLPSLSLLVGLWWLNLFNFIDGIDGIAGKATKKFIYIFCAAVRKATTI
ncbi:hypothetical protein IM737_00805 [Devosia sp. SL43]|nr:hypothetical protein IM737_00805 [Devosia sp. SL43]